MTRPALIPTTANADAAWERYSEIAKRAVDDPKLLLNRAHCEEFTRRWEEWRDLFLAMDKQC